MGAHRSIGSRTGIVGVLGHPVGHSLSPRIHNAALAAQDLDVVYLAFDVRPERLSEAVLGIRALGFRGANVTIPTKRPSLAFSTTSNPLRPVSAQSIRG